MGDALGSGIVEHLSRDELLAEVSLGNANHFFDPDQTMPEVSDTKV